MATTRAAVFDYVLNILDYGDDAKAYMIQRGITDIRRFVALSDETFTLFVNGENSINEGHMIEFQRFRMWLQQHIKKNGDTPDNWVDEFTEDVWESYMLEHDDNSTLGVTSVKQDTGNEKKTTVSNVKVDIKAYPTFSGKINEWKAFKREFTAIARTHKLRYLLEKDMSSLEIDETSQEFKDENAFLHSALTFSLALSTSISKVSVYEKTLNGRAACSMIVS